MQYVMLPTYTHVYQDSMTKHSKIRPCHISLENCGWPFGNHHKGKMYILQPVGEWLLKTVSSHFETEWKCIPCNCFDTYQLLQLPLVCMKMPTCLQTLANNKTSGVLTVIQSESCTFILGNVLVRHNCHLRYILRFQFVVHFFKVSLQLGE